MEAEFENLLKTLTDMGSPASTAVCHPKPSPGVPQIKTLIENHIYGLLRESELTDPQIKLLDALNCLWLTCEGKYEPV